MHLLHLYALWAALAAQFALCADSLSTQLLQVVANFDQSDPAVSQVRSLIKSKASIIDAAAQPRTPRRAVPRGSAIACAVFRLAFPSIYVGAENPAAYTAEEDVNYGTNCRLPAKCFVVPHNTLETAIVLKVISVVDAEFQVRGGGHNANAEWGSTGQEGVLIDMQKLKTLSLDSARGVVQVGPGNRNGDVYEYLAPHKISFAGGSNLGPGVAGLAIGGGYPIIPSFTGPGADSVANFEVILGNSTVVHANPGSNIDLYKSLKGGGNQFGIITRLDLKTVPLFELYYETVVYNPADYKPFLTAFFDLVTKKLDTDKNAGALLNATPFGFQLTFLYAGGGPTRPAIFSGFDKFVPLFVQVPPTDGNVPGYVTVNTPPLPPSGNAVYSQATLPVLEHFIAVYEEYARTSRFSSDPGAFAQLGYYFFGKLAKTAGFNTNDVLSYPAKPQIWWHPLVAWSNPADAAPAQKWIRNLANYIARSAGDANLDYKFPNTASYEQDVWAQSGYLPFMQGTSCKYDRGQVFQRLLVGGWLVNRNEGAPHSCP